jgi:DNA-directed RNA polymerase specialized sigma24 family protein
VRSVLVELSGQVSRTSFQVLYLRWIEGLPTAEVAAALELTPQQVRFRTHRMKLKIRRMLERSMD